jgi:hypothetical protein
LKRASREETRAARRRFWQEEAEQEGEREKMMNGREQYWQAQDRAASWRSTGSSRGADPEIIWRGIYSGESEEVPERWKDTLLDIKEGEIGSLYAGHLVEAAQRDLSGAAAGWETALTAASDLAPPVTVDKDAAHPPPVEVLPTLQRARVSDSDRRKRIGMGRTKRKKVKVHDNDHYSFSDIGAKEGKEYRPKEAEASMTQGRANKTSFGIGSKRNIGALKSTATRSKRPPDICSAGATCTRRSTEEEDGNDGESKDAVRGADTEAGKKYKPDIPDEELQNLPRTADFAGVKVSMETKDVSTLLHTLQRGAHWNTSPAWKMMRGAPVAVNRATLRFPEARQQVHHAWLRAGMADVLPPEQVPWPTMVQTVAYRWLRRAISNPANTRLHGKYFPKIPVIPGGIRQCLWRSEAGRKVWMKLAKGNAWLTEIIIQGVCVYGWRTCEPPHQPSSQWPAGPRDAAKLQAVIESLEELIEIGAAEWVDEELSEEEWQRLLSDPKAMRKHMERLHRDEKDDLKAWRVYTEMVAILKHTAAEGFRIIQNFATDYANNFEAAIHDSWSHKGMAELVQLIDSGDCITALDAMKYFYQFPMSARTEQCCYAWVRGRRIRLKGGAMGLSILPLVAQRVTNIVCAEIAKEAPMARVGGLIDDLYVSSPGFLSGCLAMKAAFRVCERLKVQVKPSKCVVWPHVRCKMLRNTIDTTTMTSYSHLETQMSIRAKGYAMMERIASQEAILVKEVASLLGVARSTRDNNTGLLATTQGLQDLQGRMLKESGQDWGAAFILDAEKEWMVSADIARLVQVSRWGGKSLLNYYPDPQQPQSPLAAHPRPTAHAAHSPRPMAHAPAPASACRARASRSRPRPYLAPRHATRRRGSPLSGDSGDG